MAHEMEHDSEEYDAITWELQSFTINHELKSTGLPELYLDRANGEFGIVSASSSAMTTLAQYPDGEPVYFQGKTARAASWRAKCRKISLLFDHCQIDFEFTHVEAAHSFLRVVENIAMAAGNHFFYSYEVPL
jgi:histone acetyltransferase HTATIP